MRRGIMPSPGKSFLVLALAGVLALAACERESERPSPGAPVALTFSHSMESDLSGYYLPESEVRIGNWSFGHVFVGQSAEFEAWEAGSRSGTFAPVLLQFDDVTSRMVQTEIGEGRSVTVRVLPTTYSVTDTRVRFAGHSAELGAVQFAGVLDPDALATSRRNLGQESVVLIGTLKVGDAPARSVKLRWWGGD